jgi:hypothetical protein
MAGLLLMSAAVAAEVNQTNQTGPNLPSVAKPSIKPDGGTFAALPPVQLKCATPGAQIHYTLDGSAPTVSSPVYDKPMTLSKSGTLRAQAFKDGLKPSAEAHAEFIQWAIPVFTTQPESMRIPVSNDRIYFTVAATGPPDPTFHWEIMRPTSKDWTDLPPLPDTGGTEVLVGAASLSLNGTQVRCTATNSVGAAITEATITVFTPKPVLIVQEPASQKVTAGKSVSFSVEVKSDPAASYQWWQKLNGNGDFEPFDDNAVYSGTQTNTLTIASPTPAMSGEKFRCIIMDNYFNSGLLTTDVTLTVDPPPRK